MFDIEATVNWTFEGLSHEGLRVKGSDELIESDSDAQRWWIQCIQSLLWLKVCTASQFSPLFEQSFAPIPKWLAIWVEDAIQTHGHTSDGQRRHLRWEGRAWIKCSRRGKKHFPGKASLCSLVLLKPLWRRKVLSNIWKYRVLMIVHLCMHPCKLICYHHFLSNKYGIQ